MVLRLPRYCSPSAQGPPSPKYPENIFDIFWIGFGINSCIDLRRSLEISMLRKSSAQKLGRLDSNQDTEIQSLVSYQLDDIPKSIFPIQISTVGLSEQIITYLQLDVKGYELKGVKGYKGLSGLREGI